MLAEINETLHQVKLVVADAAHLNRQMPKFLERLEEVLDETLAEITSQERKIDNSTS